MFMQLKPARYLPNVSITLKVVSMMRLVHAASEAVLSVLFCRNES